MSENCWHGRSPSIGPLGARKSFEGLQLDKDRTVGRQCASSPVPFENVYEIAFEEISENSSSSSPVQVVRCYFVFGWLDPARPA